MVFWVKKEKKFMDSKKMLFLLGLIFIFGVGLAGCSFPGLSSGDKESQSEINQFAEESASDLQQDEALTEIPLAPPADIAGPTLGSQVTWVDDSLLVFVPGGEFLMGMESGNDNPQRLVRISPFWIHRTEVTNRMYALCMATGRCGAPQDEQSRVNLANLSYQEHPVTGVTWEQAATYCEWIEGRLPTEAEWEKTARGTDGRYYPWGQENPSCDFANFGTCLNRTSPVREHLAGKSFYEALGMAGNAAEWVSDWYDPLYYQNAPDVDPQGPVNGIERVVRGGGYASPDYHLPSATRFSEDPLKPRRDLGFRCIVERVAPRAPYCVTSQFVPGDSTPVVPPSTSYPYPESGTPQTGAGCSYGYIDFSANVEEIETNGELNCEILGNRVRCTGRAGVSQEVVVCHADAAAPSAVNLLPLSQNVGNCPPGYTQNPDGFSCSFSGVSLFSQCTGDFCFQSAFGDDYDDDFFERCPIGMYYDWGVDMCVGELTPDETPEESPCVSGFDYDEDSACCVASTGIYPGCGPNEFMSSVGCIPYMPRPDGAPSGISCEVVTITTGACTVPEPTKPPSSDEPEEESPCPPGETYECNPLGYCYCISP
jgi:formylglycine-generating enzyme required for sulfatase activity